MPKDSKKFSNVCEVCKEVFVVISLARLCELKHSGATITRAADSLAADGSSKDV